MAKLDIYWSFRSPYSYLAIDRLAGIVADFDLEHSFCFVRPLAMREPHFFEKNRPQWLPYLLKDVMRESARQGVAFAPPRPDPIAMDMASGKVDAEQPLMDRLMALGIAAEETARGGLAFARAIARRIWGGVPDWNDDGALAAAAKEANLSLATLTEWAEINRDAVNEAIARNEAAQLRHHWGVPLMVVNAEEPFFGQDRLDALVWRLELLGLRKAPESA